jgi:hypothetical protein
MHIDSSPSLLYRLLSALHTVRLRVQCVYLFYSLCFCWSVQTLLFGRRDCLIPTWVSTSWSVLRRGKTALWFSSFSSSPSLFSFEKRISRLFQGLEPCLELRTENCTRPGSPTPSESTTSHDPSRVDSFEDVPSIDYSSQPQVIVNASNGKRQRTKSFTISVDLDCRVPAPKKAAVSKKRTTQKASASKISLSRTSKAKQKKCRAPLGERSDSGNSPSSPLPRDSCTPFTFNPSDPLWMDKENHAPWVPYIATPTSSDSQASPHFHTHSGPQSPPQDNYLRDNLNSATSRSHSAPRNLVLYHELEIGNCVACADAPERMQRVLAVGDIVLDDAREESLIRMVSCLRPCSLTYNL